VFEGLAQAQSLAPTSLQVLEPNLSRRCHQLPCNSGETVRITVADEPRNRRR
jgi:hypothetical protein